jgi:hypothetical protein
MVPPNSPIHGLPSDVDRNAPVTIPAWLFEKLLAPQRSVPLRDPGFDPPPDLQYNIHGQYGGTPSAKTPNPESGGGVPNPFRAWEPVGRNQKLTEAAEPDTMDDTGGN